VIPASTPASPPSAVIVSASTRNWSRMSRRRAPTARRMPISRVRRCHGPMNLLAAISPPDTAGAILECLGPPARSSPVAPARREVVPARLIDPAPEWSDD